MIKKFINEHEVFQTNSNLNFEIVNLKTKLHEAKVVIVDNFYKNPDLIRELALLIPPTCNERITSDLPAGKNSGRINAFYLLDSLGPIYDKIIKETFPEVVNPEFKKTGRSDQILSSFTRATFMVNVMTSENLPPRVPHIDNPDFRAFASTIYLNVEEECAGGTAFYALNDSIISEYNHNYLDIQGTIKPTKFVIEDEGDWKKICLIEMKYNRMILYQQNIFHSAYIDEKMFTNNTYRLNQQFFI